MKKNKKLNSIATMSKEELQEVNGGLYLIGYPYWFPEGQPPIECSVSLTHVLNQGVSGKIAAVMNSGIMNPKMIG